MTLPLLNSEGGACLLRWSGQSCSPARCCEEVGDCRGNSCAVGAAWPGCTFREMSMEGEPSGLIRITQLFLLSTAWGMQIWVTFISGFVLFRTVSRHTFGLVQGKLFPFYFYTLLGCTFLNLAIFAAYHPWEFLSTRETVQITLFLICFILVATNASWFSQVITKTMLKMQEIEKEHGLGQEVGGSGQREVYQLLKEKDNKYRHLRQKFFRFHGLSSLCNLACVICTGVNLAFIALQLESL